MQLVCSIVSYFNAIVHGRTRNCGIPSLITAVARMLMGGGGGGGLFIYSCSARLVSFEIKFKFINLKRN